MKKEKDEPAANAANKPDAQKATKPPRKPKKEKKAPSGTRLPFLVEFVYTISILILIVLALMIIVTSILTGASLLALVLRTAVAIVVMGSLLMFISSQISSGLLFAMKVEQEEAQKASEEEPAPSVDIPDLTQVEA